MFLHTFVVVVAAVALHRAAASRWAVTVAIRVGIAAAARPQARVVAVAHVIPVLVGLVAGGAVAGAHGVRPCRSRSE